MSQSKSGRRRTKPARPRVEGENENPTWYRVAMFGFMVLGLVWILVFYISSARYPLGSATPLDLSNWNILIGFAIAMIGFSMTTRWE